MLDFERTFKLKLRLVGQFSKFFLRQQLFAFKEFCMEKRFSNIFKTTNVTNLTKVIQFKKAVIEFHELHPNRKQKNSPSAF